MIKMIRVDYRLLHGQVAVSWTANLGADAILLVSDTLENDPLRMETLKMAKPSGIKVVVKNTNDAIDVIASGKTDSYKLFIVCETLASADQIARKFQIKRINLGNIAYGKDKKQISTSIFINEQDRITLQKLLADDFSVFIQMVPTEKETNVAHLIGGK